LAIVEVEHSTQPHTAVDCALICGDVRGRMDQSVFKALVIAFCVVMLQEFS
jgi:hypothetical protein